MNILVLILIIVLAFILLQLLRKYVGGNVENIMQGMGKTLVLDKDTRYFEYKADATIDELRKTFNYSFITGFKNDINETIYPKGKFRKKGKITDQQYSNFNENHKPYMGSSDYVMPNHSFRYVIDQLLPQIQKISKLTTDEIISMIGLLGQKPIIETYFRPVSTPKNNDLVYYPGKSPVYHNWGLYKDNGMVVSLWYVPQNKEIFEHELFLVPNNFGNRAYFFRLKSQEDELTRHFHSPIQAPKYRYKIDNNNVFVFIPTEKTDELRDKVDTSTNSIKSMQIPEIRLVPEILEGMCFNYAFSKFLGVCLTENIHINKAEKTELLLNKFFERTKNPQKGDLVVYADINDGKITKLHHYGIYQGDDIVISKWGDSATFKHPIFIIPPSYGNNAIMFKLKPGVTKQDIINYISE